MASFKKQFKFLSKNLTVYFIVFSMVFNIPISMVIGALPPNGTFVEGTGGFGTVNSMLTVSVETNQAIIDWAGGMDTANGDTLAFVRDGVLDAAVLNRVTTGTSTFFDGDMTAQSGMEIFMVNQAGILFGPNASVSVPLLVASGLNITNDNFIDLVDGAYQFDEVLGTDGYVINEGNIETTEASAALIGRMVKNIGTISRTGSKGYIVIAAGDRVLLRDLSSEIVIQIESPPPIEVTSVSEGEAQPGYSPGDVITGFAPGDVVNEGEITSTSTAGAIVLAAGDTFAAVLQDLDFMEVPIIEATRGTGRVIQSGTISADSTVGSGGLINMTAADLVRLDSTSETTANAGGEIGNGGVILARSEKVTEYLAGAQIEARSGTNPIDGGEGGVVDLSANHVLFEGDVLGGDIDILGSEFVTFTINEQDIIGTNPNRGVFIVDPITLTVEAGDKPVDPLPDVIYETDIEHFSEVGVDVVLTADLALTINTLRSEDAGDLGLEGGIGDFVFRNAFDVGSIIFDPLDVISTDNGGNVFMTAGDGSMNIGENQGVGIRVGDIMTFTAANDKVTEPGKIRMQTAAPAEIGGGGDMITGSLTVDGGSEVEISAIAGGNLIIVGDVTSTTNQVPAEDQIIGQARICLLADEDINVTADKILVEAHGKLITKADIIICAGQTVTINDTSEISALAKTSENQPQSFADSQVTIHSGWNIDGNNGTITINGITYDTDDVGGTNADMPISATAQVSGAGSPARVDAGDLSGDTAFEDTGGGEGHAEINVDDDNDTEPVEGRGETPCDDCPTPPVLPPQPTNLPPIADPDFETTHMTEGLEGDLSGLVSDPEDDGLNFTEATDQPTSLGGTVTINEDGTYTYTPPEEESVGDDTFTYTVSDGENESQGLVTILLTNQGPFGDDGSDAGHMADITIDGTINLGDIEDQGVIDDITVTVTTQGALGTATVDENGNFVYTPNDDNVTGIDSFIYTVDDGQSTDTGTIQITLTNDDPNPADDAFSGHAGDNINGNVLTNDPADINGDPVTIVDWTDGSSGTVTLNPDGTFTYDPTNGSLDPDSFTYSVTDGEVGAEPVYATVNLTFGNEDPVAADDGYTIDQDTPLTISDLLGILANDMDPDNDPMTPGLVSGPTRGNFVLNPDGSFTYVPEDDFFGEDNFVYFVTDQFGGSSQATVTITVNQVVPEPVALLPAAPLPPLVGIEIAGCPVSMDVAAAEIGTTTQTLQISIARAMSTTPNVQPCSACETLIDKAAVLRDTDGRYMAAMVEVFNTVAPSNVPFTPEMGASIATAFADNVGNPDSPQFATAMEFADAFAEYVAVVETQLGAPLDDSTAYVMEKYGEPLTEAENANIAAYINSVIQTGG